MTGTTQDDYTDLYARRVHDEARRHPVDVGELAARTPLEQGLRDPRFLLEAGVAGGARSLGRDRVELPVDTLPAGPGEILEGVQGEVDQASRHCNPPRAGDQIEHGRVHVPSPRPRWILRRKIHERDQVGQGGG